MGCGESSTEEQVNSKFREEMKNFKNFDTGSLAKIVEKNPKKLNFEKILSKYSLKSVISIRKLKRASPSGL